MCGGNTAARTRSSNPPTQIAIEVKPTNERLNGIVVYVASFNIFKSIELI